jgi:predicted AAA+ superfamily ATPase
MSLEEESTRKREIEGLFDALTFHKLNNGLILTEDEEDEILLLGKKIEVLPIWKWLLT